MRIVHLKSGDEERLIEAARLFNDEQMRRERAAYLLDSRTFVMVVAYDEDGIATGRIYGHILERLSQDDLFIYEVDVVEEHRRKGIGRAMLACLKAICVERGLGEMFVLTDVDNEAGNALYRKAGGVLENSPANMYVTFTART